ncbi:ABC transporter permease [Methylobacterium sp. Leaf94]|uniref:MFS transporter n=1 Tax=unclassified Methylobacterium TaxID=2615210 RepID=UPI0006FDF0D5|nr:MULTISPECIES: MFS transporter [unclassified Methylobacterium]KQO66243.1 ABC transporter permease [Methylobacterium sp. Leaf89]KQU30144.1 ABC transporter permease [Methylobacterium sp. Leaf94]
MTVPLPKDRRALKPREVARPEFRPRPLPRRDALTDDAPSATAAENPADMKVISRRSTRGLDGFAFFVANLQTGFGPFLAVYFTQAKWTQSDIGFALTVGSLVSLLGQVPGGAFVDAVHARRFAAGFSVVAIALSAFALAMWPNFLVVLLAMAAHSAASCILTPAIAAISIGLVGHARAGERLGRNASFSALGNAVAAAGMGACGYYLSNDAVFYLTAALMVPTLIALSRIRPEEIDGPAHVKASGTAGAGQGEAGLRALLTNRALLCFGACMTLFFLANAAMLPLVGSMLTLRASETATALIAACIVVPQVVLAVSAPTIGRLAERWGRRPLLLLGFAALPIRGLLFAYVDSPELLVAVQVFDGISAAVFGVMVPLVVSDATRKTGHFNLALGAVGTAMGIGAALSTSLAGVMADRLGSHTAFLGLAIVGFAAFALVALIMPETRRDPAV